MTRRETRDLSFAVAPKLPAPIRPYTAAFDEMQVWLIAHKVCMRHQEHAIFAKHQLALFPPRPSIAAVAAAWTNPLDIAVGAIGTVGVVGWSLPQVAIIDILGLNDAVVARNPDLRPGRYMTHERRPADGYVESFRPNVSLTETQLIVTPRELPLRPAEVLEIERSWWERVGIAR